MQTLVGPSVDCCLFVDGSFVRILRYTSLPSWIQRGVEGKASSGEFVRYFFICLQEAVGKFVDLFQCYVGAAVAVQTDSNVCMYFYSTKRYSS